ncbi:nucleotide-binding domain-containing protein [Wallemia mellicola]|nr:nucleotide-binding domain-containing protein [Wallemia mellicola]
MSETRARVLIIGAGCSGMAAAYSFSLEPSKFKVTICDKVQNVGGSATSYELEDRNKFGAEYINDGVQGASPVFYNTLSMFENILGFRASNVGMQISFDKGKESFWTNVFPSELVENYHDDIKKFGKVLQIIGRFEPIFALIPVDKMLKMFGFSPSFGDRMVYPLVALFFGTGNETKHISSAILERVFLDPSMRLFEFSQDSLLASIPLMKAFPELGRVYGAFKSKVMSNGNVKIFTSREVTSVERGTKKAKEMGGNILATYDNSDFFESFDDVIFACEADNALKILESGSGATWREKKVLGNVLYKWDVTVTHNDLNYMRKHYQVTYDSQYFAQRDDENSKKAFKFAEKNWKPLYLIKMYEQDPSQIEMSFDLTHYQAQFEGMPPVGSDADIKAEDAPPTERQAGSEGKENAKGVDSDGLVDVQNKELPSLENHVYQTIYLDRDASERWTKDEVASDKIILEKWWKQQSHRWQHYGGTVPWMWTINGRNNTHYAGAWTLVNMHEVAMVSGFAAAYQLGAPYPFKQDENCARLFRLYLLLAHMSRMRGEDRKGMFS